MSYQDQMALLQEKRRELRALEAQAEGTARAMQPLTENDERQMYADQATFDQAYMGANRKAPPPLPYERPDSYKRRLAAGLQSLSPRWSKANFDSMPNDAFAIAEAQVRADAIANGRMAGLKPGEIRERPFTTSAGARVIEFDGVDAHFTQQFSRVPRRAMLKSQEEYAQMSRDAQLSRITEVVRYGQRPTVQAPRAGF
jgi:hypothetical protein